MRITLFARRFGTAVVMAAALMTGCEASRTSVTQVWQAPSPVSEPMRNILTFAARADEATRRTIEDTFSAELAERGVRAVPSHAVFPGTPPDQETARQKVKAAGFDGILVVNEKNRRERTIYVPGTYTGGFWAGYYGTYGSSWGSPGYFDTEDIVTFETTLWDMRADDKLVWAALAETSNPSSGRSFVESLTNAVVPKLERSRFLP